MRVKDLFINYSTQSKSIIERMEELFGIIPKDVLQDYKKLFSELLNRINSGEVGEYNAIVVVQQCNSNSPDYTLDALLAVPGDPYYKNILFIDWNDVLGSYFITDVDFLDTIVVILYNLGIISFDEKKTKEILEILRDYYKEKE